MRIEVKSVRAVLLGNEWHDVYQDSVMTQPFELSGVGVVAEQGFTFKPSKGAGLVVAGRLSAILAVRHKE